MATSSAKTLVALARQRFAALTHAEELMFLKAADGDVANCAPREDRGDAANNPSTADTWGPGRVISGKKIRWLCATPAAKALVDPNGIDVYGADITELELTGFDLPFALSLKRCRIRGRVLLDDARLPLLAFDGTWTQSVVAWRIRGGSFYFRNGFTCAETLQLDRCVLTGDLDLSRAALGKGRKERQPADVALSATQAIISGGVFLRDTRAEGQVRFSGSRIGGNLDCRGMEIEVPPGDESVALAAERLVIGGVAFLHRTRSPGGVTLSDAQVAATLYVADGCSSLDLREARVGVLTDESKWPAKLHLDGFVYGRIVNPPGAPHASAENRLPWLESASYFTPQPYRQLAKVLREAGDEDGARQVLIEMERRRRREKEGSTLLRNAWSNTVEHTTGFGYAPERAVPWLLALSGLGWVLYRRSYLAGRITPDDKDAYEAFQRTGVSPAHYTAFSPLIYSLENSFPLVKLGQGDKWRPDPKPDTDSPDREAPIYRFGKIRPWSARLRRVERYLILLGLRADSDRAVPSTALARVGTSARAMRWFLWAQILLGWLLATLVVSGVAGLLRKD